MIAAALCLFGFLCGSIPFGVLVTRWKAGVDVRTQGSGNIGATNVARVAGKKLGVVVLLLDAAKGAVAVVVARSLLPELPLLHAAVGLMAFLGHVFPPWLRFRGGKGVATALGVLLVLVPVAALIGAGVYLAVLLSIRVSSIGSLLGGIAASVAAYFTASAREYAIVTSALFVLMIWTHRANIGRLLARNEPKV